MLESFTFYPPRRLGVAVHIALILLLLAGAGLALLQAIRSGQGATFLLFLSLSALLLIPLPFLAYRVSALLRATYTIEREGIRLTWGLRTEDIPMTDVMWVNLASDFSQPLPSPWLSWPGAILGTRSLPQGGAIEYLAAERRRLLLIGTPAKLFAISPEDPNAFLRAFQYQIELGSLAPLQSRSVRPAALFNRVWTDQPARYLLLAGGLLSLGVLISVALVIPTQARIHLGFLPSGDPRRPVPAIRLSLLPVVNSFFFVTEFLMGLYFFRRPDTQVLAYLLWVSGALISLLFLGAMLIILQGS